LIAEILLSRILLYPLSNLHLQLFFQCLTNEPGNWYSAPQFDGAGPTESDELRNDGPHCTHVHRGPISDNPELEPAQKLDPILDTRSMSASHGPRHINLDSKADPVTSKHGVDTLQIHVYGSSRSLTCYTLDADAPTTLYPEDTTRTEPFQPPPRRGTCSNVGAGTAVQGQTLPGVGSKSDDELHRQVPRVDSISHTPRNSSQKPHTFCV
jgi:hypothetical protein